MVDTVQNLIKDLESVLRQLRQLLNMPHEHTKIDHVDVDKIQGLVIDICDDLDKVVFIYD